MRIALEDGKNEGHFRLRPAGSVFQPRSPSTSRAVSSGQILSKIDRALWKLASVMAAVCPVPWILTSQQVLFDDGLALGFLDSRRLCEALLIAPHC